MQSVGECFKNPWLRLIVGAVIVILLGWVIYTVRGVLTPFLLAFIFAYILDPAVDLLGRIKVPRMAGTVIVVTLVLALLGGVGFLLAMDVRSALNEDSKKEQPASQAKGVSAEDITNPEWLTQKVQQQVHKLPRSIQPMATRALESLYENIIPRLKSLAQYTDEIIAGAWKSAMGVVSGVLNLLVFLVVTFYLLRDFDALTARCYEYAPTQYKADLVRIAKKLDVDLRGFFRGQLMVAAVLSVLYYIGLVIAGIPYPLPVAIIAGIGNLIPYAGTFVGIVLGFIASIMGYGFDMHLVYVIIVFVAAQMMDGTIVSPYLIGKNVGFNPVIVILAIMVFGKLLGFFGVLFAVPLASLVRVTLSEIYDRSELKTTIKTPEQAAKDIKEAKQ